LGHRNLWLGCVSWGHGSQSAKELAFVQVLELTKKSWVRFSHCPETETAKLSPSTKKIKRQLIHKNIFLIKKLLPLLPDKMERFGDFQVVGVRDEGHGQSRRSGHNLMKPHFRHIYGQILVKIFFGSNAFISHYKSRKQRTLHKSIFTTAVLCFS
jgi:hypothetical protein